MDGDELETRVEVAVTLSSPLEPRLRSPSLLRAELRQRMTGAPLLRDWRNRPMPKFTRILALFVHGGFWRDFESARPETRLVDSHSEPSRVKRPSNVSVHAPPAPDMCGRHASLDRRSLQIMAGVVAMASVIEDFDTQPCKKSRKDGGSPVVKTITNYFSPVAKPAEKPFSPPRSNNIMDYFSRRPPSSKEKNSPSEQSKENCHTSQSTEKHTGSEAAVKPPSQKRGRKAIKAARRLVEAESVSSTGESDCVITDEPEQCKDSAAEVTSSCGVLGSDTAALLAQLSAEASDSAGTSERSVTVEQTEKR
ncbi:unnamed protein product [Pleuronectes platessa]|uniref:Uncharacterized protein n=1 Tax=Pleuronectes platessa TaxID=8262 RepID=A0A9N7ZEM6_PLEPL|nr:unnamed protein product [Pleuronectes platessa]